MFNFLHIYHPNPILFSLNEINVYWYGFFIVIGIILAFATALILAKYYHIKKEDIIDLAFWLVIFGILGARLYHIILEIDYYLSQPMQIFKIWQGGLAIHGTIIAGIIVLYFFTKKRRFNFWIWGSILVTGTALAQAVGRWGNYFNQELFGKPTNLPWSIPIDVIHRPAEYLSINFFHPAFLYESLGDLAIFLFIAGIHIYIIKKKKIKEFYSFILVILYFILYSLLRFATEFIRIDETPIVLGIRSPQLISIIIILIAVILLVVPQIRKRILTSKET